MDLKKIVTDYGKNHKIKKYQDQHFMIDEKTIELMINKANLSKRDIVLEIGPGLGFLTYHLLKKSKKVIAVEKDKNLIKYLNKELIRRNLETIHLDGIEYIKKNRKKFNKIVSNIPYAISEPLIMELINTDFEICILTVSKTFADTLTEERDSTKLSIIAQSFFNIKRIEDLDRSIFYPKPRKDSSVIKIEPIKNYKKMKRGFVVKELFLQPKKKIKNALIEALINHDKKFGNNEITKRSAKVVVKKLNLNSIENKTFNSLNKNDIKRILDSI